MGFQMDSVNNKKYLIIGGSIAGLSAAIRLSELDEKVVLLDAGKIPSNKVCGEFISPECHEILKRWSINIPISIPVMNMFSKNKRFKYNLPIAAKAIKRLDLEQKLLDKAVAMGVEVLLNKPVDDILYSKNKDDCFTVKTSDGSKFFPKELIIAAGKLHSSIQTVLPVNKMKFKYVGFKAHVKYSWKRNHLDMYTFPSGYIGMIPVDNNLVNIACLIKFEEFEKYSNVSSCLQNIIKDYKNTDLEKCISEADFELTNWIEARIPKFGVRDMPTRDNVYYVGDAAASLYPATGDGLAMAITSGEMVGEYAKNQNYKEYQDDWSKRYLTRIKWGNILHKILENQKLATFGILASNYLKRIPNYLFYKTRELK